MDALQLLQDTRVMPVVVIHDVTLAVPLAETLMKAGISACEVTLRTRAALPAIENIAEQVPGMIIGAGSVIDPDQFEQVADAGAKFAVSPGCTPAMHDAATLPYIPGAASASEVLALREAGYRLIKYFPAESLGGAAALKSISAAIADVKFCPTGGLNASNAAGYLELDCVACIGGSWFVPESLIQIRAFDKIGELAAAAVKSGL